MEECQVRSKDIFIYDEKDKEKFDFIKQHANYVLNDSFYYLVEDYPEIFVFHCLDCGHSNNENFEAVYLHYKMQNCTLQDKPKIKSR